ncbi:MULTISPECIES: metallophosphoesterase [Haloferax]|nr:MULTISPECIES: metallophosphoesterase [Haloferax]
MTEHTYILFGDAHIKPTGKAIDYEKISFPPDVDVILVNGDLTHRSDPESLDAGREFLTQLASHDIPVVTVPGNHDPAPYIDQLLPPPVETAHRRVVRLDSAENATDESESQPAIVGWGCDQFDFSPEFEYETFPSTDPRGRDEPRQRSMERMTETLLTALRPFVHGECSPRDVLSTLGIQRAHWGTAQSQLEHLRDEYEQVSRLLSSTDRPTIFLTHVPAFATAIDIHHSIGTREEDRDGLAGGSIALRLAIEDQTPLVHLCGHSHYRGYHYVDGNGGGTHVYNPGVRGVVRLDVDAEKRSFSFEAY